MNNQESTQEHLTKLIEFRQALYENGFTARRDALFDLLDALLSEGPVASFPMLSCSGVFRRQWPSLYAAVEDGRLDSEWIRRDLARRVPQEGVQVFPLDGSAWPRPRARTLADRQFVYHPTAAVRSKSICIGYPYSLLEWSPQAASSWSLPVDVRRIASQQTAQELGAEQIRSLSKARQACDRALDIVAADGGYGHVRFWRRVKGERCGLSVRLRRDRVLYRALEPLSGQRQRGRPRVHGDRFAFVQPETWGVPDEVLDLHDPHWGQVRLERWNRLHDRKGIDVPVDVVRAAVHRERANPPQALWLAWQAPPSLPTDLTVTADTIWRAYSHRWPVEPGIRFRKQRLGWTQPQFHSPEVGDRWSQIVALAIWLLYLARPVVEDQPLPWQKPQQGLTPQRVQQAVRVIFAQVGTPARSPKARGKPPGWPTGKPRTPKARLPVVKKTALAAQTA